jgi:hypothetical protein
VNYQVITDQEALVSFIEWLPELKETEQYYMCLFARSKYTKDLAGNNGIPHIKSDKAQLKRFTATKKNMLSKIMQLECPIGSYQQRDIPIPQQALALYITVNPRDLWKSSFVGLKDLATRIQAQNTFMNPQQEVMSSIQRTKGTTHYVVFDIDSKNLSIHLFSNINKSAVTILETRGGYHILVDPKAVLPEYKNTWYKHMATLGDIDQKGDIMIPVPGTYQGGFTPKFIFGGKSQYGYNTMEMKADMATNDSTGEPSGLRNFGLMMPTKAFHPKSAVYAEAVGEDRIGYVLQKDLPEYVRVQMRQLLIYKFFMSNGKIYAEKRDESIFEIPEISISQLVEDYGY